MLVGILHYCLRSWFTYNFLKRQIWFFEFYKIKGSCGVQPPMHFPTPIGDFRKLVPEPTPKKLFLPLRHDPNRRDLNNAHRERCEGRLLRRRGRSRRFCGAGSRRHLACSIILLACKIGDAYEQGGWGLWHLYSIWFYTILYKSIYNVSKENGWIDPEQIPGSSGLGLTLEFSLASLTTWCFLDIISSLHKFLFFQYY